jgi:small neutral amino acid transporter SnatA (MarC family)
VKSVHTRNLSTRIPLLGALALCALVAAAAPAGASTGIVVADQQFKWFYWIGIILAVSMLLWLIVTIVGYYIRVMRPKYRGRQES